MTVQLGLLPGLDFDGTQKRYSVLTSHRISHNDHRIIREPIEQA